MGDTSPEVLADCARALGPVRVAELYLEGLSGAHRDRGAAFRALSYTERLVVWDGEHEAARARATAEAGAREAALAERHASEEPRRLDIAQFLADNPGVDISSLKPRVFPGYMYLPGQECETCHGKRDGRRCLGNPECRFRYRAGFFTRQAGICPWCAEPLPADLGMTRLAGVMLTTVAIDHIIPITRGGPVHAEWNKQLVHGKCNTSKGNRVTAAALELAAGHGIEVLDFLAACQHPGPMPRDAVVHLLAPLRIRGEGDLRSPLDRVGGRFRALCGHNFGVDWFPVHGAPAVTCRRCREHRERLGPGNAPACPASCCAS
jgi:hypothetical protein